jgi:hypothetical protein
MHLKLGFYVVTFIRDWSPMLKDFVLWGSFIKKTTLQTYEASEVCTNFVWNLVYIGSSKNCLNYLW